jgi:hypothetical protein
MANKYLIHGAAFCGDGTASNEAASAGAPGAWNDIAIFFNTSSTASTAPAYGSLNAGDTVYIRSKTSGGADITLTLTGNSYLGKSGLTDDSPSGVVTWILDNGAVWGGINGLLTISLATYNATIRTANNVISSTAGQISVVCASNSNNVAIYLSGANLIDGWLVDVSNTTNGYGRTAIYATGSNLGSGYGGFSEVNNCTISIGQYSMFFGSTQGQLVLNNPTLIANAPSGTYGQLNAISLASSSSGGVNLLINGGSLTGNLVTTGFTLFGMSTSYVGFAKTFGFSYPKTINLLSSTTRHIGTISTFGADSSLGSEQWDRSGFISSRSDNNPPTLNATLPTSNSTPWSWRAYPATASVAAPLKIRTSKVYQSAAAVKTITQEFLVANTMSPTDATVWLEVTYVDDATGLPKTVSSRNRLSAPASLATSSAAWLPSATWGTITFNKNKISVTTPTAIKQDTAVVVTLNIGVKSASSLDILFVDPDPQVS